MFGNTNKELEKAFEQPTVSNPLEHVVMCEINKDEKDELVQIAYCAEALFDCEINESMRCYTKEWKIKLKEALDIYSKRIST